MSAIAMDFPYVKPERSRKIINFTFYSLGVKKNIPWTILSVILFPIYLCFIPVINITLWRLYKNLQKDVDVLKRNAPNLSYKAARKGYDTLSMLTDLINNALKNITPDSGSFLTKGIYSKVRKIAGAFSEMQESIASVLYVNADTTPLSDKEKEDFKAMNDIWGDDDDQVYARHTHHHLTKKLKGHGV
jgi:hypothetical protein